MISWKKATLLYPAIVLSMTALYTLETLSSSRGFASADSLTFIMCVLIGMPIGMSAGFGVVIVGLIKKNVALIKTGVVVVASSVLGVITSVFLTALLVSMFF